MRIVKHSTDEGRRDSKWQRSEHPERLFGKSVPQRIDTEDPHICRAAAFHFSSESTCEERVRLDGDELIDQTRQRKGAAAQASPDLDDQVTRLELGRSDQCLCEVRPEEVLSETTSLLVSWRPPDRGHGPSPRCP